MPLILQTFPALPPAFFSAKTIRFACLFACFWLFSLQNNFAQQPNWASDVAPILYKNCVSCHRPGNIAPFDLVTFEDAFNNRFSIAEAIEDGDMPPWPPEPSFRHFVQERLLTDAEKETIHQWVETGGAAGNLNQAPPVPVFPQGGQFGPPARKWQIPTYTVNMPPNGDDLYRCFVIHNDLPDTNFMSLMEVVPGNRNIVHHILVYQQAAGESAFADWLDPEPGFVSLGPGGALIGEWVPGQKFLPAPQNTAFRLKPNSDIVVQVHYPQGSQGQVDSTYLNIYLVNPDSNTTVRELTSDSPLNYLFPNSLYWLTNSMIEPYPLLIPANESKNFVAKCQINKDISVISIAPHAHYINKSFEVFGVTPLGDIINLIKIPKWEFHWQGHYYYPKPVVIPSGTTLFAKTVYDNTADNPENPFDPPQEIMAGEATTEEMLLVYMTYMDYRPGDEDLLLYDSTVYTPTLQPVPPGQLGAFLLECMPNPATDMVQIICSPPDGTDLEAIEIFDLNGRMMERLVAGDGKNLRPQLLSLNIAAYPSGTYIVRANSAGATASKKLVVLR